MKILSLVPSITETLFDFGLNESSVAGRTKFCVHPATAVRAVPVIGGTKNIHVDKIRQIRPDLIIASREENVKSQVQLLQQDYEVWVTDIADFEDNAEFITRLGDLLNKPQTASEITNKIDAAFDGHRLQDMACAYLIWKNPLMTVGRDTFIHAVMQRLGLRNIFESELRYPVITAGGLDQADFILLSTEPYPFSKKDVEFFQKQFPGKKVLLVDGEAFSWYGSHLARSGPYFTALKRMISQR